MRLLRSGAIRQGRASRTSPTLGDLIHTRVTKGWANIASKREQRTPPYIGYLAVSELTGENLCSTVSRFAQIRHVKPARRWLPRREPLSCRGYQSAGRNRREQPTKPSLTSRLVRARWKSLRSPRSRYSRPSCWCFSAAASAGTSARPLSDPAAVRGFPILPQRVAGGAGLPPGVAL